MNAHKHHPERLLKHRFLDLTSRDAGLVGQRQGLRYHIFNKFSDVADAVGLGPNFE